MTISLGLESGESQTEGLEHGEGELHVQDEAVFAVFAKLEDKVGECKPALAIVLRNQLKVLDRGLRHASLEIVDVCI